jgi:AAA+ ATPase superfamily predicted ATPase
MAVEIVDRDRELRQLRAIVAAPPALVVLRGRRRVGKSFLLRVALPGERLISYQAEVNPQPLQLEAFAAECARLVPGAPDVRFATWDDALAFVEAQAREQGPLTVVIDEFQRVAAQDESIESKIQNAWDRWDHENVPLALVLSGSALSFMAGLFQGGKPTHGRSAMRPLLQPLSYRDIAAFGPSGMTPVELVERFSVLGGTPQYLRWAAGRPLEDVIEEVILSPDAPLYDDPEHLIREEENIREPGPYFGIMQAIARGYTNPTAIGGRLQISSQLATNFLGRLTDLAYVAKVEPLEPRHGGQARAYWKIGDPYFRFWFGHVFPNRSRLARGRIGEVAGEIERALPQVTSLVFEDLCREWIGSHSELGADADEVGSWWSRKSDVEIDLVTLSRNGYGLLGSCKWSSEPIGPAILDQLHEAKATLGPKAAQARLALFSKSGFAHELAARAESEQVVLVEVSDLFG